jgi:vesicle-fusing ATPase
MQAQSKLEDEFKFSSNPSIFSSNFRMEDLGIGGLDKELVNIFRRAFASRRFPPSVLKKDGITHVRGVLLYGPPGTGETLIARQLAQALRLKEPEIVNGPELFNKFVGQTEENIRNLFKEAIEERESWRSKSVTYHHFR